MARLPETGAVPLCDFMVNASLIRSGRILPELNLGPIFGESLAAGGFEGLGAEPTPPGEHIPSCGVAVLRGAASVAPKPRGSPKYAFGLFQPERFSGLRVMYSVPTTASGNAMQLRQLKLPSESVMADLCLGLTVASLNALIGIGLVVLLII